MRSGGFFFFGILVSFSGNQPDSHGNELLPRLPAGEDPPQEVRNTLKQHRVSYALHMYVYECASANIYTDARFFCSLIVLVFLSHSNI